MTIFAILHDAYRPQRCWMHNIEVVIGWDSPVVCTGPEMSNFITTTPLMYVKLYHFINERNLISQGSGSELKIFLEYTARHRYEKGIRFHSSSGHHSPCRRDGRQYPTNRNQSGNYVRTYVSLHPRDTYIISMLVWLASCTNTQDKWMGWSPMYVCTYACTCEHRAST